MCLWRNLAKLISLLILFTKGETFLKACALVWIILIVKVSSHSLNVILSCQVWIVIISLMSCKCHQLSDNSDMYMTNNLHPLIQENSCYQHAIWCNILYRVQCLIDELMNILLQWTTLLVLNMWYVHVLIGVGSSGSKWSCQHLIRLLREEKLFCFRLSWYFYN